MHFLILTFVVIVYVMSYISFGGIIVDLFTMVKAKKYVKLRGNYSFKNVGQFFIFSMVIFGISWLCIGIYVFSGIYSIFNSQPVAETLTQLETNARGHTRELIKAAVCHLFCIAAGFITINSYKAAKKSRAEFELPDEKNGAKSVVCESCGKINKSVNKFCVCCGKDLSEETKSN